MRASSTISCITWNGDLRRVDTPNPRYNSGVFFRNDKDGAIWHQAQTGAGAGGYIFADTMVNGEIKRMNLAKERKGKFEKAAGEWNATDIRCEGKHCSLTINDQLSSEGDLEVMKGYLGLESEGYLHYVQEHPREAACRKHWAANAREYTRIELRLA